MIRYYFNILQIKIILLIRELSKSQTKNNLNISTVIDIFGCLIIIKIKIINIC